ncbi:MAG: hypothetical protein V2B18_07875 [Pseudomonadota bacterium]
MNRHLWLATFVLLSWGLFGNAWAQWPLTREQGAIPKHESQWSYVTSGGRYQVVVSPHLKDHTFMLDSDTGRVWVFKKDHSSGEFSLKRIPVDEVDAAKTGKPSAGDKKDDEKKPASN